MVLGTPGLHSLSRLCLHSPPGDPNFSDSSRYLSANCKYVCPAQIAPVKSRFIYLIALPTLHWDVDGPQRGSAPFCPLSLSPPHPPPRSVDDSPILHFLKPNAMETTPLTHLFLSHTHIQSVSKLSWFYLQNTALFLDLHGHHPGHLHPPSHLDSPKVAFSLLTALMATGCSPPRQQRALVKTQVSSLFAQSPSAAQVPATANRALHISAPLPS